MGKSYPVKSQGKIVDFRSRGGSGSRVKRAVIKVDVTTRRIASTLKSPEKNPN
jgi:ribosomal protein S1